MKILEVTGMNSKKFGGLESFFVDLVDVTQKKQSIDFIFQYNQVVEDSYANALASRDIKIEKWSFSGLKGLKNLFNSLRRNRPDIVHFHFGTPTTLHLLLCKMFGVKKIIKTYHSCVYSYKLKRNIESRKELSFRHKLLIYNKLNYNLYDKITAVSHYVENERKQLYRINDSKIQCLYLGRQRLPKLSETEKFNLKRELGINDGETVITTILFADPIKGIDVLVNALKELKNREIRVIVVGMDPERQFTIEMKQLSEKLGIDKKINWVGITNDICKYLNITDLYVQPSYSEGLPLSCMEALSLGIPVIASEAGGLPEVANMLFPIGDSIKLAEKISAFLDNKNLIDSESNKSIENFSKFDSELSCKRYSELYIENECRS